MHLAIAAPCEQSDGPDLHLSFVRRLPAAMFGFVLMGEFAFRP
jgi:hypothetical protein